MGLIGFEDLDFTYIGKDNGISSHIDSNIEPVIKDFGLSYNVSKNKGNVIIRDGSGAVSGTRTELFIEGPLFEKTGVRHKIKIDLSTRNDTIMKPEAAKLVSRYSDIGTILVYKMPVEEILAEKFCADLKDQRPGISTTRTSFSKHKKVPYNEDMLVEKLKKRGEPFDKKMLLECIGKVKEDAWKEELAYLVKNLPELAEVKSFIKGQIS